MKTDALFLELTKRNNIYLYKEVNKDKSIRRKIFQV